MSRPLLLLAVVLVLCTAPAALCSDQHGSSRDATAKRPTAVQVSYKDDFTLTPEQQRLLFEDSPISLSTAGATTAQRAAVEVAVAEKAAVEDRSTAASAATENATADRAASIQTHSPARAPPLPTPSSPATSLSPVSSSVTSTSASPASSSSPDGECSDDFGGVTRLLSALFSPSAIRHAGRWSLHTSVSQSDYERVVRLLRGNKAQDALDLVTLGERLLTHSATYRSNSHAWQQSGTDSASEEDATWAGDAPFSGGLVWLQRWVGALERLLHHKLVAPLHLPSTASLLVHGAVVLLLPTLVFVALRVGARAIVRAVTPSTALRRNSPTPPKPDQRLADVNPRSGHHPVDWWSQRVSSSDNFASALWMGVLLLLLTLFVAGYVHHYHTLHIEQLARNRVLQSNPPPGCYQSSDSSSLASLLTAVSTYLTRSKRDDACWRYEVALLQSSWPNPLLVLSSYLASTLLQPMTHVGEAMGGFTAAFLSHHSIVMQGVMLAFLLAFSLGVVALCMVGGKVCLLRWCGGCGRSGRVSGRRVRPELLGAVRGGRRQLRDDKRQFRAHSEESDEDQREEEEEEGEKDDEEAVEEAERRQRPRRPVKERGRREEERQLLRLLSSERVGERQQDSTQADEEKARARDSEEERHRARANATRKYSVESKREHSPPAQPDRAAVAAQQQVQHAAQRQVATVKKEEEDAEKSRQEARLSSAAVALPPLSAPHLSSSTPTQFSPQVALQQYPIARPSSAASCGRGDAADDSILSGVDSSTRSQQEVGRPPDAKVKKEEAVEWSSNPNAQH